MTVVVESFVTALAGGVAATAVTVNKPSGVVSGDLLMLLVGNEDDTDSTTFPARTGWTKQFEFGDSTVDTKICLYTRISDGTEASSETITWSTGADSGAAWYLRITGHHPTSFFDTLGTSVLKVSGGTEFINLPSLTPSVDDCLVFAQFAFDGADATLGVNGTNWPSSIPANQELKDGTLATEWSGAWVTQLQTTTAASNVCQFTFSPSDGTVGVQFAIAPAVGGATVTDINTNEVVVDAEADVTFTTSGFGSEISTAKLVSGTAITNATGVTSSGGAGDFDLPDVAAFSSDTVGSPFTSANNSVVARLGDGTDTADLAVAYNPKSGWARTEIASAVKTTGSIFENFVGTIVDESLVYFSTADTTSVDATGIVTTDATADITMQFWDKDDDTWKQLTLLITSTSDGAVSELASSLVQPLVRNLAS